MTPNDFHTMKLIMHLGGRLMEDELHIEETFTDFEAAELRYRELKRTHANRRAIKDRKHVRWAQLLGYQTTDDTTFGVELVRAISQDNFEWNLNQWAKNRREAMALLLTC